MVRTLVSSKIRFVNWRERSSSFGHHAYNVTLSFFKYLDNINQGPGIHYVNLTVLVWADTNTIVNYYPLDEKWQLKSKYVLEGEYGNFTLLVRHCIGGMSAGIVYAKRIKLINC